MKKALILSIFIINYTYSQSIEITPLGNLSNGNLKIRKSGIGLHHATPDGSIQMGSYVSNSGAFFQTHTDHPLHFTTNNSSPKLSLGTNGFFGINTTTPQHPLTFPNQLGDKISLWGGNSNTTNGHYGMGIQGSLFQIFSAGPADDIAFGHGRSGSFIENARIKGNGNVGIGINPLEKLHVNGNIRSSSLAGLGTRSVGADANGNLIVIQSGGSGNQVAFSGSRTLNNLSNNETNRLALSEIYDLSNNLNSEGVNGSRFDVPVDGVYHFSIEVKWQGNANGLRRIRLENQNGVLIRLYEEFPPNAQDFKQMACFDHLLTAGTSVFFQILQTSGTSLAVGSPFEPIIVSCHKVN